MKVSTQNGISGGLNMWFVSFCFNVSSTAAQNLMIVFESDLKEHHKLQLNIFICTKSHKINSYLMDPFHIFRFL